ncbi:MAG TPA: ATP-binding protein [Thermoleophilaceae bacterium]|jgi:anti-sigma regulatory factor (Ser/Thr protein kinase)
MRNPAKFESRVTGSRLHAVALAEGAAGTGRTGMSVELEPGTMAAGEARAALAVLDGRIDRGILDDIRLLVSELVTNSVRHARGAGRELVGLDVVRSGGTVRVEVSDGGTGFQPRARTKAHDEPGGWGLHLVDRLADRWGVEAGRRARVWFEIDR